MKITRLLLLILCFPLLSIAEEPVDGKFPKGHPLYDPLLDEDITAILGIEGDEDIAAALAKLLPRWISQTSISTSFGYTDNVTQAAFMEDSAIYLAWRVEYFLSTLPDPNRDRWTFFAFGELLQYGDTDQVDNDTLVMLRAEWAPVALGNYQFKHHASYVFWDSVLDSSAVADLVEATGIRFHDLSAGSEWAYSISKNTSAGVMASLSLVDFADLDEDYLELEAGPFVRWQNKRRSLELFLRGNYVNYDDALNRQLNGALIADDEEVLKGFGLEFSWKERLNKYWRTDLTAEVEKRWDNGVGYDDYLRIRLNYNLRWTKEKWRTRLYSSLSYTDYDEQIAELGDDDTYETAIWRAGLEGEYRYSNEISFIGKARLESRTANRDTSEYDSLSFELGLKYTFPE